MAIEGKCGFEKVCIFVKIAITKPQPKEINNWNIYIIIYIIYIYNIHDMVYRKYIGKFIYIGKFSP